MNVCENMITSLLLSPELQDKHFKFVGQILLYTRLMNVCLYIAQYPLNQESNVTLGHWKIINMYAKLECVADVDNHTKMGWRNRTWPDRLCTSCWSLEEMQISN